MPGPSRSENLTPPREPLHQTAPTVDERPAGMTGVPLPKDDLSFLQPPQAKGELGWLVDYRVLKELGRGGMGCVLLAEDTRLHRKVALKVMLPQHASNPTARNRFLREARAAARIKHDHIVTLFQVDEVHGVPFIALEYLEGAPLDKYLKDRGTVPLGVAVRIAREMAAGLQAAHTKGLIHRDIKPGNIWLEAPKGRVKLLDFGLARAEQEDTQLTQQGAIIGTPAFMAPEQARGEKVDARSDLWSLGVVLYRMCTGKPPFAGPTTMAVLTAIAVDTPLPARSINPTIPEALERIIHRLLEKDPARRYASAQEVITDLNAIAKTLASDSKPTEAADVQLKNDETMAVSLAPLQPVGEIPSRRRLSLLVGLAGGLAALLVLGLVILWPTPQGTVRIESDDPDVQIVIDQNGPTTKGVDKLAVQLRAGEHGFVVRRGDLTFATTNFVLKKGETVTLKVEHVGGKLRVTQDGQVLASRDVPLAPTFTNKLGMEFVLVPKGKFWMGGGGGMVGDREMEIAHDFYLGKYEVTQEEWEKVTGVNPSSFSRTSTGGGKETVKDIAVAELKRFPVETVSWDDCQAFLKVLNAKAKETGWKYRIPIEAEWEYACRGGPSINKFDYGFDYYFEKPSLELLPTQANFNHGEKSLMRTCKVGSYPPNKLGLYDMHGNVWEWCNEEAIDDKGASNRVVRGGGYGNDTWACRAAFHNLRLPSDRHYSIGLRLARVPVASGSK
ncbi:MAG: bifunctional serine/threonine-protein kinase/formylglycine-generating enzyme family protein [Gemmataceae bacterium]